MERRHIYGGGIATAGLFFAIVQLVHGLQQTTRGLVLAFEAGPFVLVALTLTYAGYWLATNAEFETDLTRVLTWGAGGMVLFASVGALQLFSQRVFLGTLDRAAYVAIDFLTVGAVVGVLVGLYDARGQRRRRELKRERDRIEAFGNKAADVNNYGSALNTCSSVDEVSALAIQAMQALLGLSEVAVLALTDDDVEVVDDTILNVSPETLASLGRDASAAERATVVTHEEVPSSLTDRAEAVISLELATVEGGTFVLVALAPDRTTFAEEDIQLIELLASHAGTAIASIYRRSDANAQELQQD